MVSGQDEMCCFKSLAFSDSSCLLHIPPNWPNLVDQLAELLFLLVRVDKVTE